MLSQEKLLNEYRQLEALAGQLLNMATRTRAELERITVPAPSGVKKRKELSPEQKNKLVTTFRKKMRRA